MQFRVEPRPERGHVPSPHLKLVNMGCAAPRACACVHVNVKSDADSVGEYSHLRSYEVLDFCAKPGPRVA